MIKVNVEVDHKRWLQKIKNPKNYFKNKLIKISKTVNFFMPRFVIYLNINLYHRYSFYKLLQFLLPTDA